MSRSSEKPAKRLIKAISENDKEGVSRALQDEADPDTCMAWEFPEEWGGKNEKVPVLTVAAANGYAEVVSILLGKKANANIVNSKDGTLPIHYAAFKGDIRVAKLLQSYKSKLDPEDEKGNTPLHAAASQGESLMSEWLIQHGVEVEALNDKDKTPADLAESNDNNELAQWLRSCESAPMVDNAQLTTKETTSAVKPRTTDNFNEELSTSSYGASANYAIISAKNSKVPLPSSQKQINSSWYNRDVSKTQNPYNILELGILPGGGSDYQSMRFPRLCAAVLKNDSLVVSGALDLGENPNTCMPFKFVGCKWEGREEICGKVPLLTVAASKGYDLVVKVLLEADANTEDTGDIGMTPLAVAIIPGHFTIVKQLLAKDADVNASNSVTGTYPIHYAAGNGQVRIAQMLCDKGSELDALNNNLCSPLHIAARCGNISMAEWLNREGVDLDVTNDSRNTAAEEAKSNGYSELAMWLQNRIREGSYENEKGRILFFNYVKFDDCNLKDRTGAEEDNITIRDVFEIERFRGKYEVIIHENLSTDETVQEFKKLQQDSTLDEFDSLTIFIASHGKSKHDFCTKDGEINIIDLRSMLIENQNGCVYLKDNPKIIMACYCQGNAKEIEHGRTFEAEKQKSVTPPTSEGKGRTKGKTRRFSAPRNMKTIYQTSPGASSPRFENGGNLFIQAFCGVLIEEPCLELQQLIVKANKKAEDALRRPNTFTVESSNFNHFYF